MCSWVALTCLLGVSNGGDIYARRLVRQVRRQAVEIRKMEANLDSGSSQPPEEDRRLPCSASCCSVEIGPVLGGQGIQEVGVPELNLDDVWGLRGHM